MFHGEFKNERGLNLTRAYIYAIKHNKTGRVYVGETRNIEKRISAHLSCLRTGKHSVQLMQDDYDKYGEDYTYYLLFDGDTDRAHLMAMESAFMLALNTISADVGYNYKEADKKIPMQEFVIANPLCSETDAVQKRKAFGKHLEAMRNNAGLSLTKMASKIGVTPSSVQSWERGRVLPSREHYLAYEQACRSTGRGLWIVPSVSVY